MLYYIFKMRYISKAAFWLPAIAAGENERDTESSMLYADIVLNRKMSAEDRVFTYGVPEDWGDGLTPGMLVKAPFHREVLEGVVTALRHTPPDGLDPAKLRLLLEQVGEKPLLTPELLALSSWLAQYYLCPRVAALQAMLPAGLHLSGRPPREFFADYYRAARPLPQGLRLTEKRRQLLACLDAASGGELEGAVLAKAGFAAPFLRDCCKTGLLLRQKKRIAESGAVLTIAQSPLSPEQSQVFAQICGEWQEKNRPFLLHGITGSGKTEIYLKLIEKIAAEGGQAIVLVPEIALSGQMLAMLQQRLALRIAVLHSGLAPGERRLIWQDIAAGRYDVVVGPRSAVFAPLPKLKLLIVDEEHENSYKQENQPRFHAVAAARQRATLCHAHLLLGSATPSVESYYLAQTGVYALGQLRQQYYAAPPPAVEIVDMRRELRQGNTSIFSGALRRALAETLAEGGQSILFLNRRGYYNFFSCRDCGASVTCPHCSVAMAYHADDHGGKLKCHYCGRIIDPPSRCPVCGSPHIRRFGVGSQRVADEAQKLLPQARILRLDSDVVAEEGGHQRIYQQMRQGQADILVGTQMLAKGLDFPGVRLAAVIAADTMLNLPDWRAPERTFQLISQLCGRAGRRERQGQAIVQTYCPEALPVVTAAAHDYLRFYQAELEERQLHGYPPFCHLLRLLFTGTDRLLVWQAARQAAAALAGEQMPWELCGPAEAPFARIKDRYRVQIVLKTTDLPSLRQPLLLIHRQLRQKGVLLQLDVDPLSMM